MFNIELNRRKRCENASEAIQAGLRLLEEEENKVQVLKKAFDEGIRNGVAKGFDVQRRLATLKGIGMC
ncbi:type II toxin-antitoxin system ParD family antitoxin [Niabella terrae]